MYSLFIGALPLFVLLVGLLYTLYKQQAFRLLPQRQTYILYKFYHNGHQKSSVPLRVSTATKPQKNPECVHKHAGFFADCEMRLREQERFDRPKPAAVNKTENIVYKKLERKDSNQSRA